MYSVETVRTPEGLTLLCALGTIKSEQGRGSFVADLIDDTTVLPLIRLKGRV